MTNFLFHKISEEEKKEIKKQAKGLINKFEKKLSKLNLKEIKEVKAENQEREEEKFPKAKISREIMFKNAQHKNKKFIIAEKKTWN